MSANNWGKCPYCQKISVARIEGDIAEAEAAYGRVPLEEWKEIEDQLVILRETLETWKDDYDGECEFREDYEIGLHEGVIRVTYSGYCRMCGYGLSFKDDRTLPDLETFVPAR